MDQKLRRDAELRANNYSDRCCTCSTGSNGFPEHDPYSSPQLPHSTVSTAVVAQVSQPPQFYSLSPPPPPMTHHLTNHGKSSLSYHNNHSIPKQEQHSTTTPNGTVFHTQQQPPPQSPNDSTTTMTDDIAIMARQEWQQYGKNKTQILEDLRYGRYYYPHNNHRSWKIGKVIRAEERVDITGASYTTYIIHIWDRSSCISSLSSLLSSSYTSSSNTTTEHCTTGSSDHYYCCYNPQHLSSSIQVIERRYSDFCKLYNALVIYNNDDRNDTTFTQPTTLHSRRIQQQKQQQKQHNTDNSFMYLSYDDWYNAIQSIFPSKHWTGRIGNWTPAKYIAPQQYYNTIQERIQAFDTWFVYVLYAYNIYPQQQQVQQQQQQQQSTNRMIPFLSEQQNTIIHNYITNPSPPPPYMIRSTNTTTCTPNSKSNMSNSNNNEKNDGSTSVTTSKKNTTTSTSSMLQYHNPVTFTLSSAIRQATTTIQIMTQQQQQQQMHSQSSSTNHISSNAKLSTPTTIPIDLLHIATGIVFLTVAKLGMIVSGRVGTGLFIAKRPITTTTTTTSASTIITTEHHPQHHHHHHTAHTSISPQPMSSWSAPVAVGTIGLGWGAVVGGDVTHYMIVFTTEEAVRDFGRNHTVNLGTELGISIGPTGMAASQQIQSKSKNLLEYHSTYAYAISSGLFLGVSLEGSMISIRHDVNAKFYGQTNVSVMELLRSPGVPAAEALYEALDIAIRQEIPEHAIFKLSRYLHNDDENDTRNGAKR